MESAGHGFNPHQPVKAGASQSDAYFTYDRGVSILTSPLRLVLLWHGSLVFTQRPVSILTSPLRLVLRPGVRRQRNAHTVSILTSPLRLVLRGRPRTSSLRVCFNPHQPVKAGASINRDLIVPWVNLFQSSPAR